MDTVSNMESGAVVPAPVVESGAATLDTPAKRGRGRPRGSGTVRLTPPGAFNTPAAPGNKPPEAITPALWTAENCRPMSKLPFLVAGMATGYDGFALDDKEAQAIAEPLAAVLTALVPSGGKYAAVLALSSTLFVVGGMKLKNYREWKAGQVEKGESK